MSLDDKFNPHDGSLIDTLDTALFEFNKRIATVWQDKTYRSKADLERVLYLGSAATLGGYAANTMNPLVVILAAGMAWNGVVGVARPHSALYEEIANEACGLPRKTTKYAVVITYGLGVANILFGAGYVVAGAMHGGNELYMDSINSFTTGLGVLGYLSADYMAKSDIGNPPPKLKKKPILERMKEKIEELLPSPIPELAPVKMYSEMGWYSLVQLHW